MITYWKCVTGRVETLRMVNSRLITLFSLKENFYYGGVLSGWQYLFEDVSIFMLCILIHVIDSDWHITDSVIYVCEGS